GKRLQRWRLEQVALLRLLEPGSHRVVALLQPDGDHVDREPLPAETEHLSELRLRPRIHGHASEMMDEVLGPGHDPQVAEVVVEGVVVDVVDDLVGGQRSTEVLLDDETMYGNLPAVLPAVQMPLVEIVMGFHAP